MALSKCPNPTVFQKTLERMIATMPAVDRLNPEVTERRAVAVA
jgi:hypothetical protein